MKNKKTWYKPKITTIRKDELNRYIKAAARSGAGCTGAFER